MENMLDVYSPTDNEIYHLPIVREKEIPGYGTMYTVTVMMFDKFPEDIPVIVTDDGYQFTPWDWSNPDDEEWMTMDGTKALMLDGLPRNYFC